MTKKSKDGRLKQLMRLGICVALIALIALIGVVMASAEEVKYSEGLKFTSNGDGTCYVSGIGSCTDTEIVIPSMSPSGDTVTIIGNSAFRSCSGLTSVTIPKSVTSIGDDAFSFCSNLTSIAIPKSVTSIGRAAFFNCSSLTNITIPDSVISIGDYAFSGCSNLASITVDKYNAFYHVKGNCLIETATKTLVAGCKTSVIPDDGSVTSIGDYAFFYCSNLTSIAIPKSVTSIGRAAFFNCSSLTSVTIPDSVTSIGEEAFIDCTSLTSIVIPDSVTSISGGTFSGCTSLTSIVIPNSVTSIGEYAFIGSGLTNIAIPNSVTSIGNEAFSFCSSLTSIAIPNSVTSISFGSFAHCDRLADIYFGGTKVQWKAITIEAYNDPLLNATIHYNTTLDENGILYTSNGDGTCYVSGIGSCTDTEIVIPSMSPSGDTVTIIGNSAFRSCSGLTSVTIPKSVTSIGRAAFFNCSSLTNITIPDSVISIGDYAFSGCSNLASITVDKYNAFYHVKGNCLIETATKTLVAGCKTSVIPDDGSVTSIGDHAFFYCSNLTSIAIPKSVTSIGNFAFSNCSSLTSVTIPDSVTSIGEEAFFYCTSLTSIVIPDSVTSISGGTFSGCTSLTSIVIPNSVTSIGEYAFFGSGLTNIAIPNSVTSIGNEAFSFCSSLTSIAIPNSVTSIGEYAFSGSGLTNIAIPNSVTSISFGSFARCDRLADIYFGGTKVQWKAITIEAYNDPLLNATIHYNTTLDENGILYTSNGDGTCYVSGREPGFRVDVVIPSVSPAGDTVTAIGEDAFAFANIKSVQLPDTLKLIGGDAFSWNNSLLEVSIPASVTHIGAHAFGSCEILRVVDIPANSQLTCIDSSAFYYCYDLLDIIIPENVTSIGASAFAFCHDLEAVIPKSVTYIGDYAFQYTSKVTFAPGSPLTEIGEGVFMGCNTRYFILPSGIKTIGDYAFQGCDSQGFFFPAGLTEIGYAAFDAYGAIWFYYEGTEEAWNKITIGEKNEALLGTPDKYFLGDSFFTGASLTLGESLTMNYYATLESVFGQATVRFTYRGETFTVKGVRDKESGEYVFSLKGITPQCMGENIKAELIFTVAGAEWILDTKETYSVRQYCDDALAANPDNKALATLLADLLAYGDAAQDYTGFNADFPVSDGFAAAPSEWEDVTDTDFTLSDKTRDDIRFTSAGVRFGHINRLYFKLKAADLTGVTLTVNGKTYTAAALTLVEDTTDTYILYTDPIYATEFDKVFNAELCADGEVIQTLTYSVKSYVYAKQNSENSEMAALVRALYAYGRSAIAYKQEQ